MRVVVGPELDHVSSALLSSDESLTDGEAAGHDSSRLSSSRFNTGSARDGSSLGGSSPQTPHLASRGSSPQNPARASGSAAGAPPKGGGGGAVPRRGGIELLRMPTLAPNVAPAQRELSTSSRPQVFPDAAGPFITELADCTVLFHLIDKLIHG